ncbi:MAG TPA: CsoR family transcriptional regulator [Erysipelotrichaceae bacterium]|nr:CsoR family transcriptional regulator [Erysipelotrichaceae bacterium]
MDHSKHTHRESDNKSKLINRLNRLEGQIRGIKSMVEEDVYCDDILIQVAAVKSALDAFSSSLFEEHLKTCVVRDIKANNPEIVEEVLTTIKRLTR